MHEEQTGEDLASYIDVAFNLNLLAVAVGQKVQVFKIFPDKGALELLQSIPVRMPSGEAQLNCVTWTVDNGGIAVGGDEGVLQLFKI